MPFVTKKKEDKKTHIKIKINSFETQYPEDKNKNFGNFDSIKSAIQRQRCMSEYCQKSKLLEKYNKIQQDSGQNLIIEKRTDLNVISK